MPTARDFEESTLWNVSEFERVRRDTGTSGFSRLDGPTLLPTTLLSDLERLGDDSQRIDVLEVVAACMRHREAALLLLQYGDVVWPVALFPAEAVYHSPRDMALATPPGMAGLKLLAAEPPGVRPPGHRMHDRVGQADHYRALAPLLWALALHGPRKSVLGEIAGTAAYRAVDNAATRHLDAPGALGSAIERLKRESVSLRQMATWPGMSVERASRLLNGLYLLCGLLVTRTHPAARSERSWGQRLFGLR
jgi:hypothetical protein